LAAATARALARYGASVLVAGHRRDGAETVAKQIRAEGGTAIGTEVELTEEEQVAVVCGGAGG
jgi:NAD(P)-dependent dehydrogenase (short-subunit alcohol dehydrogenase family)